MNTEPAKQDLSGETNESGLAARRAVLDALGKMRAGALLDEALLNRMAYSELDEPDRRFARALISTTLRRQGALDHIIGAYLDRPLPKKAIGVVDILRIASAQALFMETPAHASVSTAVHLAKERRETAGYAKLINAVSRKITKTGPHTLEKLPLRIDTPSWLWRSWERAYGPVTTKAIAQSHRSEPPLDLVLKTGANAQDLAHALNAEILDDRVLRLRRAGDVTKLEGFASGQWWVQDYAASLPARLLRDIEGKRVFDLCAAPGGKTMQLADRKANVIAVDQSGPRLIRLSQNLERVGLNAEVVEANVLHWRTEMKADAILLDAPCSATGTIRRNPDIAWVKRESDVAGLAQLQTKLIDRALELLKPGGQLVYCVCSLQAEEGEHQAEAALARHGSLKRLPVDSAEIGGFEPGINRHGDLRTLPSMNAANGGMDGFFAARFVWNG